MHDVALDLLILLAGIWIVAVTLRPLGLPTIMGELIVGVLLGPAVFGFIEPSEAITLLAEIGIFFLMFHAGVETQPVEFFDALKRSMGVALVGAAVPFAVAFSVARFFGLDSIGATFVGLTMTATAVVVTLKSLKDLGLANTRLARVIVASCVIDDLLTLVVFGLVLGVLSGGEFALMNVVVTLGKVALFFGAAGLLGGFIYPRLTLPFRSEGGKGFTFILFVAFGAGLFAEAIGLHMILGAYLAGLFFEEKVAHPNLVKIVADRSYGIAYSFLGPIFFISLGFSVTFDLSPAAFGFLVVLTLGVILGQIVSAGGMAMRLGLSRLESLTVGIGMCGRAELAFILASLALTQGAIDSSVFSVLIFTAFVLNLFTPLGLKGCAVALKGRAPREEDATRGIVLTDKFESLPFVHHEPEHPGVALPNVDDGVVIYRYGPEVETLVADLETRSLSPTIIEPDVDLARRLSKSGHRVVHGSVSDPDLDLSRLAGARAVVINGADDETALLALGAREAGFAGPIIAMIDNPTRRAPMTLAGVTASFAPRHVLAAVLAARASDLLGPRVSGLGSLTDVLEVAEVRIHEDGPLVGMTLASAGIRAQTGTTIVGQWSKGALSSAPAPDEPLEAGTILVAVGSPESVRSLGQLARPLTQQGALIVVGHGALGRRLVEILRQVGEQVFVIAGQAHPGADLVGDVGDLGTLSASPMADARAVVVGLDNDAATVLAITVVRGHAPDVPIIAGLIHVENTPLAQRAGADFALSVGQVAGQLLAHHVLGESVSLQARIKLMRVEAGDLAGKDLFRAKVRERTGCSIVAVERSGVMLMDLASPFVLEGSDSLYVCGTHEAVAEFRRIYPPAVTA